jgi:hypothetical protein
VQRERDQRATVAWRTQAVLASVAANGGVMNGVNVASAVRNVAEALDRCRAPRAAVLAVLHDARFHQQLMALVRTTSSPQPWCSVPVKLSCATVALPQCVCAVGGEEVTRRPKHVSIQSQKYRPPPLRNHGGETLVRGSHIVPA